MPRAKSFLRRVASAARVRRGKMVIAVVLVVPAAAIVAVALAALEVPAVAVAVGLAVRAVTTLLPLPHRPQLQRP